RCLFYMYITLQFQYEVGCAGRLNIIIHPKAYASITHAYSSCQAASSTFRCPFGLWQLIVPVDHSSRVFTPSQLPFIIKACRVFPAGGLGVSPNLSPKGCRGLPAGG